ncbi:MAG: tRNA (adenosine(37)-N6)-dimethylallyltransferase MiaA [Bdellovibrionales bacterium]|nr:tRNA (adenosine(37)-N6)-dimethylallyltransferase MiaA [Bdellovibrionales bacterium]
MKKNIFILGSTGVGKSSLALKISQELNKNSTSTAIVNADSLQFYKGLDIGTAKPSKKEMLLSPHLLFDCINYPNEATVAWYYEQFFLTLNNHSCNNFLTVGGSGFYIQALEKGLYDDYKVSLKIKEKYENMCKKEGPEFLHKILIKKDTKTADKISNKDRYRVVRALSVIEASGKMLSTIKEEFDLQKSKTSFPYLLQKIALFLERDELKKLLLTRIQSMLKKGFIEEVEYLVKKGQKNWKPLSSIGYKEVQLYLLGQIDKCELTNLILNSSMSLAKRQSTWFKRDKTIQWFHAADELNKAEKSICNFLQKS